MRQTGMLVVAFVVTLTVLSGGFFALQSLGGPAATPAPTATLTPTPEATSQPTARPTLAPTPTPAPIPSSAPAKTPRPSAVATSAATATPTPVVSAAPSASGSEQSGPVVVVVLGKDYTNADVPQHGVLTKRSDGAITIATDRTFSAELQVTWELPPGAIPRGSRIRSIDVKLCGTASGDFWESYGPTGSEPDEYEVTQPQADGCWHYADAPGPDTSVTAKIRLGSTMTITRLEYTVTVAN